MAARCGGRTLQLTRWMPATRPVVFGAFTDPRVLAKWWGPTGFTIPGVDLEARSGASYRIEMQPPDGAPFFLSGVFRAVDPPLRLVYSFVWEAPAPDDVETLVELSFADLGESTQVELTQGQFQTQARWELHRDGWTDSFDKLGLLLSQATV